VSPCSVARSSAGAAYTGHRRAREAR